MRPSASARQVPTGAPIARRVVAEAIGAALLLSFTIGLRVLFNEGGNAAAEFLAQTLLIGAAVAVLIVTFGSTSGAHLNPAVTLAAASQGGLPWHEAALYIAAQIGGAILGAAGAASVLPGHTGGFPTNARPVPAQLLAEFVATFGLLAVVWGCMQRRPAVVPFAVGAYVGAACWFTGSTSLSNPAVTLAHAASGTLAGTKPAAVPGFILAQLLGAAAATALFRWLVPALPKLAVNVVVPHGDEGSPPGRGPA